MRAFTDGQWGRIAIRAIEHAAALPGIVRREIYSWIPAAELMQHGRLPDGFQLDLECRTAVNGTRRFHPMQGWTAFSLQASLGGTAIHFREVRERRFAIRMSSLLLQHARRRPQYFGGRFRSVNELCSYRLGSYSAGSVIASIAGMAGDRSQPFSVGQLLDMGRCAAVARNVELPSQEQLITLGLTEVAC
ncbi:MAG: hypothetical protein KDA75_14925, partial [Planctomycetaceae bacterium]|nr:hypothetical protein [Planctomycetaceae bacterium]